MEIKKDSKQEDSRRPIEGNTGSTAKSKKNVLLTLSSVKIMRISEAASLFEFWPAISFSAKNISQEVFGHDGSQRGATFYSLISGECDADATRGVNR